MLQISKRFEFAAAHKYWDTTLSDTENIERYGIDAKGKYGHGHNFIVYVSLTGSVNPETGMIEELSAIKQRLEDKVFKLVDHRFLNILPLFKELQPTPEHCAEVLFSLCTSAYADQSALSVISVDLIETPKHKAKATRNGTISTIRSNGVQISLKTNAIPSDGRHITQEYLKRFDAITHTETSLDSIFALSKDILPVYKLEREQDSYIEGLSQEDHFLVLKKTLRATHCLQNPHLSDADNDDIFGKCQFVHGHDFDITVILKDSLLTPEDAQKKLSDSLDAWQYKSLNEEVPELQGKLCSCETIIYVLKDKFSALFSESLKTIVLQETPNNIFELSC
jgi:6-pyruvoyl-tetrahydropterin synthase